MPLIVKDYKWKQTDIHVIITVPLKGIHNSKVDIFTSEQYIKANYSPFFFEVFLLYPIKESSSRCTLAENEIVFELEKCECNIWETLENTTICKQEALERKQKIIEETQERLQKEQQEKIKLKGELKRLAVRKQISLDSERLDLIQKLKYKERNKVMLELEDWKEKKNTFDFDALDSLSDKEDEETSVKITELPIDTPTNKTSSEKTMISENRASSAENETRKKVNCPEKSSERRVPFRPKKTTPIENLENLPIPVPLPRRTGTIDISFSERVFPTPSRESRSEDEQEWLRKQAEMRRAAGWVPQDLRPEEREPDFLKEKGDTFFKQKNYIGAISAYGYGIKLSPKYPALYVNRSAAHFAFGNLHKCIEDCSTALELLTPPVPANLESRAKCYARRGAALCKLGLFSKGCGEFHAALKLMPDNDQLKKDLEKAEEGAKTEKNDEPSLFLNKQPLSFTKK